MTEKAVLCSPPVGPVWYCAFAKLRIILPVSTVFCHSIFFVWQVHCADRFFRNSEVEIFLWFYCATIAYHVELNTISRGRRHPANVQAKEMFSVHRISQCCR